MNMQRCRMSTLCEASIVTLTRVFVFTPRNLQDLSSRMNIQVGGIAGIMASVLHKVFLAVIDGCVNCAFCYLLEMYAS